jgi:hypothetical protein
MIISAAFRYLMDSSPNLTIVPFSAFFFYVPTGMGWPSCGCILISHWTSWTKLPHHLETLFATLAMKFAQHTTRRNLLEKLMRAVAVNPRSQTQQRTHNRPMARLSKKHSTYKPTNITHSMITAKPFDGLAQQNRIARPW